MLWSVYETSLKCALFTTFLIYLLLTRVFSLALMLKLGSLTSSAVFEGSAKHIHSIEEGLTVCEEKGSI